MTLTPGSVKNCLQQKFFKTEVNYIMRVQYLLEYMLIKYKSYLAQMERLNDLLTG